MANEKAKKRLVGQAEILRAAALALTLGFLAVAPFAAGKLGIWQGLLTVLSGSVGLLLWLLAGLQEGEVLSQSGNAKQRLEKRAAHSGALTSPLRNVCATRGPDAIDITLVAFIVWACLSWFGSVYRFATSLYIAKLCVGAGIFWLLRYGLWREQEQGAGDSVKHAPDNDTLRHWRIALWAVSASGVFLSLAGLREYVRSVYFLGATEWRIFGPMANPNAAAGYLLLTIFPAAALLLGAESRARGENVRERQELAGGKKRNESGAEEEPPPRYTEIVALFGMLLMGTALLLTGSKAGLLGLLVGAALFGYLGFAERRSARLAVWGLCFAIIVGAWLTPPIRTRLVHAFGWQSHSMIFRLYTWQATLDMVAERPLLGFGGGTFENVFPRFAIAGYTRAAHQTFLQLAAETGVPSLLLGLLWGGLVLVRLTQLARHVEERLVRLAAAGAVASLGASALQEGFDYAWYVPGVAYCLFAWTGIALAPGAARKSIAETEEANSCYSSEALWRSCQRIRLAAIFLTLALIIWAGKNIVAETLGAAGERAMRVGDISLAIRYFERAQGWNPAQARFPAQLSRCWEALAVGGNEEAWRKALTARQRAIALQPTEPQHYLALARLYEARGELQKALFAARQALIHYPNYPRGLETLGRLQEKSGERSAALRTYQQLLALQEGPVGRYRPAEAIIETAYVTAWRAVGDAALEAGRQEEALAAYSRGVVLLSQALDLAMKTREATGGEEIGIGNLPEDIARAEEMLERLARLPQALARMREAQLFLALRRYEEGRWRLQTLAEQTSRSETVVDQLARQWGTLRLAQEIFEREPTKARILAERGQREKRDLRQRDMTELAGRGWLPEDTVSLQALQEWAQRISKEKAPE